MCDENAQAQKQCSVVLAGKLIIIGWHTELAQYHIRHKVCSPTCTL